MTRAQLRRQNFRARTNSTQGPRHTSDIAPQASNAQGPSLADAFAALHSACLPPFAAAPATRELLALVDARPDLADERLVAIEIRVDERKAKRQAARARLA